MHGYFLLFTATECLIACAFSPKTTSQCNHARHSMASKIPRFHQNAQTHTKHGPQTTIQRRAKKYPGLFPRFRRNTQTHAQNHCNRGQHEGVQKGGQGYPFRIHIGFYKSYIQKNIGFLKSTLFTLFETNK